jgi:UDP-glucose 4-epimerase
LAGVRQSVTAARPPLAGVRCVVLGAAGFLGRRLAAVLSDAGATVVGFGHASRERFPLDERVRWTEGDVRARATLTRALDGAEVVFHLLGPAVRDVERPADAAWCAQDGETDVLLGACRDARVRTFVFASSGGAVYGNPATVPTSERDAVAPVSAYGAGCVAIERRLAQCHAQHGLGYRILRIGNAYGPGQSPFRRRGVVATTLFGALSGQPVEIWGSPWTTRDYVHVDDVATACVHVAAYAGPERVFNVGSGRGRTLAELVADVKELLGVPIATLARPARPLALPISVLDTSLIARATGWQPSVPWLEGLADTARWQRAAYGL